MISKRVAEKAVCWCDGRKKRSRDTQGQQHQRRARCGARIGIERVACILQGDSRLRSRRLKRGNQASHQRRREPQYQKRKRGACGEGQRRLDPPEVTAAEIAAEKCQRALSENESEPKA